MPDRAATSRVSGPDRRQSGRSLPPRRRLPDPERIGGRLDHAGGGGGERDGCESCDGQRAAWAEFGGGDRAVGERVGEGDGGDVSAADRGGGGFAAGASGDYEGAPAFGSVVGFKPAAIFGTLAAIYRGLAEATNASNVTLSKRAFYEGLAQAARQTISAMVDEDGDGVPETRVWGGVREVERV